MAAYRRSVDEIEESWKKNVLTEAQNKNGGGGQTAPTRRRLEPGEMAGAQLLNSHCYTGLAAYPAHRHYHRD